MAYMAARRRELEYYFENQNTELDDRQKRTQFSKALMLINCTWIKHHVQLRDFQNEVETILLF
jgi:hypothetical protein